MLPIHDILPSIKDALRQQASLIVQAPPGAGKSTVLPLALLEEAWLKGQKIVMLEPRRLAARSVAARMASLLQEPIGQTVGYAVRFERKTSAQTRLEVVTEGILTRMLQQDSSLEGIGLVIFDEFHERSLHADLALALCREAQQVLRDDLRILVMSATLDGERLSGLLKAPILTSLGRQYPIVCKYEVPDAQQYLPQQMARAIKNAFRQEKGDILAFFPGTGEIAKTAEMLEDLPAAIHQLYGDLPLEQQQQAIMPDPQGRRKVVLATSIAETSLTIEGISTVVDSGFARVPRFDARTGLTKLETQRITRDAADQRAGRAGRLGPGVCYRLWSEGTHAQLEAHRQPEIMEADLAPTLLELANWGVTDLTSLAWLTQPPAGALAQGKDTLIKLGALSADGKITPRGKQLLRLPTHPRIAHLLLESQSRKWEALAADVAALLEERDPFSREQPSADVSLRVEALRKMRNGGHTQADRNALRRIDRVSASWRSFFKVREENTPPDPFHIGWLLSMAYPERVAKQVQPHSPRYQLVNGRMVRLPEHDALASEPWLAVAHLDAGAKDGKVFLAAPIDGKDLQPLMKERKTVRWDAQQGVLLAQAELVLGEIVASAKALSQIPEEEKQEALMQALQDEPFLLDWTEEVQQWQARVNSLCVWRPEEGWPPADKASLIERAEEWLLPFVGNAKKRDDFKRINLMPLLPVLLTYPQQQELERLAPEKLPVPSGSHIKIEYFPDGSKPVLAVRLQELFGLLETPSVNGGRMPVLLHLLSPGYKPVQVTQDLKSFWQNTYPEVRKELRLRYPKHSWPEDPWTAEAVRGAIKRRPT